MTKSENAYKSISEVARILELINKKNGKLIRWYANGLKSEEEFYKNDEKHGKFKYWFDNGRLEKEEKYSNGVQTDGKHYDYFDN